MRARRAVVVIVVVVLVVVAGVGLTVLNDPVPPGSAPSSQDAGVRPAAVLAATQFLVGLDAETLLDDEARRRHVRRWASRETESDLQRVYDIEAGLVALQPNSYSRVTPVGYRVQRLASGSADVVVWAVSLAIVSEEFPVVVGWRAAEVGLVREDGQWRVGTVTDAAAPTPESPAARFRAESAKFEEYRLAP